MLFCIDSNGNLLMVVRVLCFQYCITLNRDAYAWEFKERCPTCGFPHLWSSHFPTWKLQPGPQQVSHWGRACSETCAICSQPGSTWCARSTGWSKARQSGKHVGASVRSQSCSGLQIWRASLSSSGQSSRSHWHRHLPSWARTTAGLCFCLAMGPSRACLCPPRQSAWMTCSSEASLHVHQTHRSDDGAQSETWQLWPWHKFPKTKSMLKEAKCSG